MADQILEGSGHMHFSGNGAGKVRFGKTTDRLPRVVTHLYLTTTGATTISFDGGANFMDLTAGTHVFPYPHTHEIHFGDGSGNWSGVGISV